MQREGAGPTATREEFTSGEGTSRGQRDGEKRGPRRGIRGGREEDSLLTQECKILKVNVRLRSGTEVRTEHALTKSSLFLLRPEWLLFWVGSTTNPPCLYPFK